jgi:hypothetical protein
MIYRILKRYKHGGVSVLVESADKITQEALTSKGFKHVENLHVYLLTQERVKE